MLRINNNSSKRKTVTVYYQTISQVFVVSSENNIFEQFGEIAGKQWSATMARVTARDRRRERESELNVKVDNTM